MFVCSSTLRLDFMSVIVHFFVFPQRNEPKKMNQGRTLGTPTAERFERGAFGTNIQQNRDALGTNTTSQGLCVYDAGKEKFRVE